MNLDSVEEVFLLNVKFQQHLKLVESQKLLASLGGQSLTIEESNATLSCEMVDNGPSSLIYIVEDVYLN